MRTSTFTSSTPPSGLNDFSWMARSSFTCMARGTSPISSRKIVPVSAVWKSPALFAIAPVNEPFLCPKSSLSMRFSGIAPQFTVTNGFPRRMELKWIAFATISFPVPLSPVIRTVVVVSLMRSTNW